MAVLHRSFLRYIKGTLRRSLDSECPVYEADPLLGHLLTGPSLRAAPPPGPFSGAQIAAIVCASSAMEAFGAAFPDPVVNARIARHTERRLVALKKGFPRLPATTAAVIMRGFGTQSSAREILDVYASHGLSRDTRELAEKWNFSVINRRAQRLAELLADPTGEPARRVDERCRILIAWMTASRGQRETVLELSPIKRSVFFHWWGNVSHLGLLGLVDSGRELLRSSKIGPANEARIVIDRLQHPERSDSFYVRRLATMGVEIKRDAIAKVFSRWGTRDYSSAFVSNLQRLEALPEEHEQPIPEPASTPTRLADQNYVYLLEGMRRYPLPIAAPGLLTLWAYIEELGLFPLLHAMGLTSPRGREKYSWFDLLLFDIARRFYGIATLSGACEHEGADLAFFTHLCKAPCNDTVLNGLGSIAETHVRQIRRWLVDRLAQLGLASGRRVAFDFHQIDQDVLLAALRGFGKGPSPNKKICYTGFRPHIAWDVESGTLLAAEFRKSSARGTTTVRRFVSEYLLPTFRGLFKTVYIDSEYTGKDVWNFILDERVGMGAHLTGCLRQNPLVKKGRDLFLMQNRSRPDLWRYYDDNHVHADRTFPIEWEHSVDGQKRKLCLTCAVKKHVKTGRLRCFGTSKEGFAPRQILEDYSSRWTVENGIKDLIGSYFLDKCPGTEPRNVDVHFLATSICRTLYRMIERDLGDLLANSDGTTKTLGRTREILFRQGPARIGLQDDSLVVTFSNAYSITRTELLTRWFNIITTRHADGLALLGGLKLRFELRVPMGDENRNAGARIPLAGLTEPGMDDPDPALP